MNETEAEDKEVVQVWKTSLDSMLVFVGVHSTDSRYSSSNDF